MSMNRAIKILLQCTIPTTVDDWSIARFKRPKRYVFLSELPKNNYGKVLKTKLREDFRPGR